MDDGWWLKRKKEGPVPFNVAALQLRAQNYPSCDFEPATEDMSSNGKRKIRYFNQSRVRSKGPRVP